MSQSDILRRNLICRYGAGFVHRAFGKGYGVGWGCGGSYGYVEEVEIAPLAVEGYPAWVEGWEVGAVDSDITAYWTVVDLTE